MRATASLFLYISCLQIPKFAVCHPGSTKLQESKEKFPGGAHIPEGACMINLTHSSYDQTQTHNIHDKCTISDPFWATHIHATVCHTGLSTTQRCRTGGDIDHYTATLSILWQAVPQQKVPCTVQTVNVYTVSRLNFTLATL
jgi:hypothetical protein